MMNTSMGEILFVVLVLFFAIFYGAPLFTRREKGERLMSIMSGVMIPTAFVVGIGLF